MAFLHLHGLVNYAVDMDVLFLNFYIRYLSYPQKSIGIIDGDGDVLFLKRTPTKHEYVVYAKNAVKLKENTNYFPGWKLKVNDRIQKINYRERNHEGRMVFMLNPGLYHIIFTFEDTPIRYYSKMVSGITLCLLLAIVLVFKFFRIRYALKPKRLKV